MNEEAVKTELKSMYDKVSKDESLEALERYGLCLSILTHMDEINGRSKPE